MKIAIPLADGLLARHFGHCSLFAFMEVPTEGLGIVKREDVVPPPHEPGVLPAWMATHAVTHIIAGGMGQRALDLFKQNQIEVVVGAPVATPEALVQQFLAGSLVTGVNVCDH